MEEQESFLIISDVMKHLFCPRFTFFIHCLHISEHEEARYKVQKGRDIHETKMVTNSNYLRKDLGVIDKKSQVFLASKRYKIKGILDEILYLSDGTSSPFEYKYSSYSGKNFKTRSFQIFLQALLIRECLEVPVNRGYICYTRSNNKVEEIPIDEENIQDTVSVINDIFNIISSGYYPPVKAKKEKCIDCAYRNICV